MFIVKMNDRVDRKEKIMIVFFFWSTMNDSVKLIFWPLGRAKPNFKDEKLTSIHKILIKKNTNLKY